MIANPPWHHQLIGRGGGRGGTIDNYPDTARSDGSVPWFLRGFETICEQDDVGCRSSIGAGIESSHDPVIQLPESVTELPLPSASR
jgi:hypothetical protein